MPKRRVIEKESADVAVKNPKISIVVDVTVAKDCDVMLRAVGLGRKIAETDGPSPKKALYLVQDHVPAKNTWEVAKAYCEERMYWRLTVMIFSGDWTFEKLNYLKVIIISNDLLAVSFHGLKALATNEIVTIGWKVVLLYGEEGLHSTIFDDDFDDKNFVCAKTYYNKVLISKKDTLTYQRFYHVMTASYYLKNFSTDRALWNRSWGDAPHPCRFNLSSYCKQGKWFEKVLPKSLEPFEIQQNIHIRHYNEKDFKKYHP